MPPSIDALIDALRPLARVLAPLVADELGVGVRPREYSTESPASYPPGKRTRRAARDRIRAVPGHRRIGKGRASVWSIDVVAYEQHHARAKPARAVERAASSDDDEALAAAALSGLRSTRER